MKGSSPGGRGDKRLQAEYSGGKAMNRLRWMLALLIVTAVPAVSSVTAHGEDTDSKPVTERKDTCACTKGEAGKEPSDACPCQARGGGSHRRGRGRMDPQFQEDHDVFFYLLSHRDSIQRTVNKLEDGVETITESEDPEVAAKIQEHVHAMHARLTEQRPIHQRDPLFRALFAHADEVEMKVTDTDHGVRVRETSADPKVAKMIQAHAEVVSLFIKNGHAEMRRDHAVP